MQAIILAAGMGKRLKALTAENTKCMIRVNNKRLIDRMLEQLDCRGLHRIIIVVGYQGQHLIDHVNTLCLQTPIQFIENHDFETTNNIHSLYLARNFMTEEDTILLESDLIFDDAILDLLLDDPRETLMLVDQYQPWMNGTCVTVSNLDDTIESFVSDTAVISSPIYKTVNLYKFSRTFSAELYVPFLDEYRTIHGNTAFYEQVLHSIIVAGKLQMHAVKLCGQRWYEIDDQQDLDTAEALFSSSDGALASLQNRYGGYWRCGELLDFCYLVNPFFPTPEMLERIKSMFDKLLTSYPSGMNVITTLAAGLFNLSPSSILVGNGASELIPATLQACDKPIGLIDPSFAEFKNRIDPDQRIIFTPQNQDYSYTVADLIAFFDEQPIRTLILVNPDNPTGNYISHTDLEKLIAWTAQKKIQLIIDESFADFANEANNTLLSQKILNANPHLSVIKSLSKCYGIPGIRLGILASSNNNCIASVQQHLPIWNINSFAEFFLQILGKQQSAYTASLELLRKERSRMEAALQKIPKIRVIPSQANYVMVQTDCDSSELTERMLSRHQILVKNLSEKTDGQSYLRFAIRNPNENDRLLHALRSEIADLC